MKIDFIEVKNGNSLSAINANFEEIRQELQNKVYYRDNPVGEPNTLIQDMDANGQDIFNVGQLDAATLVVNGQSIQEYVDELTGNVVPEAEAARDAAIAAQVAAEAAQAGAEAAETNAGVSETNAAASAASALVSANAADVSEANALASEIAAAASAASIAGGPVASFNTRTGAVTLTLADVVATGVVLDAGQIMNGELRLNGANLQLSRYNGNLMFINGALRTIPASGPTLGVGGLSASTLYYIYAFMSGSIMTLEASVTGMVTDATTGIKVKNGDATRTLVGLARTNASTAWQDDQQFRWVISYYNRKDRHITSFLAATTNFTATATFQEVNANLRCNYLSWGEDEASFSANGGATNTVAATTSTVAFGNQTTVTAPFVEGVSPYSQPTGINNVLYPIGLKIEFTPALGENFVTLIGAVTAGTGQLAGSGSMGTRVSITGRIKG